MSGSSIEPVTRALSEMGIDFDIATIGFLPRDQKFIENSLGGKIFKSLDTTPKIYGRKSLSGVHKKRGDPFLWSGGHPGEERGLPLGFEIGAELQPIRISDVSSMDRHDFSGHLLFKLFSFIDAVDLNPHLLPQLQRFVGMKEKPAQTHVADRDVKRTRSGYNFRLPEERDAGMFSLFHTPQLIPYSNSIHNCRSIYLKTAHRSLDSVSKRYTFFGWPLL